MSVVGKFHYIELIKMTKSVYANALTAPKSLRLALIVLLQIRKQL